MSDTQIIQPLTGQRHDRETDAAVSACFLWLSNAVKPLFMI